MDGKNIISTCVSKAGCAHDSTYYTGIDDKKIVALNQCDDAMTDVDITGNDDCCMKRSRLSYSHISESPPGGQPELISNLSTPGSAGSISHFIRKILYPEQSPLDNIKATCNNHHPTGIVGTALPGSGSSSSGMAQDAALDLHAGDAISNRCGNLPLIGYNDNNIIFVLYWYRIHDWQCLSMCASAPCTGLSG